VISPRDLYRLGARLYGKSIFRNVACELEERSDAEVRATLTISPRLADSPRFFHLMLGALRSGPRFLGLPDVPVKMERSPGRAVYTIQLPRSNMSLRSRIFTRLRFHQPAVREVIDELTQQQREALSSYRRLAEAHERLQSEIRERERAESQLRRVQRLDVVGRLAAGIAHDFKNQLAVIMSYVETGTERAEQGRPVLEDFAQIRRAASRASKLTNDLLTFSRETATQPAVLDVNDVIVDMKDMMRRMIGDHIELSTRLQPELGRVLIDRAQIEQVVLNLALNARDAMPNGGTITLETEDCRVVSPSSHAIPELQPGEYVVLSVSDTGCGIDERTRERMFEPFFTTKPIGSGTGLGLSMVYGIVLQSGGHTAVSSRPGAGSSFQIYLPRTGSETEV
jgi:signal transduction histidine kinase